MKIIKKVKTQREKRRNHQSEIIRLSNLHNAEIVYMPYGENGSGYYIKEKGE